MKFNVEKMPEAEVSLRLAMTLIYEKLAKSDVEVAIDGAQIQTAGNIHFPMLEFMEYSGWSKVDGGQGWHGEYVNDHYDLKIIVHSKAGKGDVVCQLSSGRFLRAESKKGTLERSKSSAEYKLMREAIGQLMTVEQASPSDLLAVIVPSSEKNEILALQWRQRPLIKSAGIRIATVDRENSIRGLEV